MADAARAGGRVDAILTLIGRDGREVAISPEQIAQGGFVVQTMPRPGEFALPAGPRASGSRSSGKPIAAIVPHDRSNVLVGPRPRETGWLAQDRPARRAGGRPARMGGRGLDPGARCQGLSHRSPDGPIRAEPFVPKFDRDHQGTWRAPALLDPETVVMADDDGRVHRVELKTTPVPRLVGEAGRRWTSGSSPTRPRPGEP